MRMMDHPNVVQLRHSFIARGDRPDQVYLNLVMEFIPDTIFRTLRTHKSAKKRIPTLYMKLYAYQVCRAIGYVHSLGICHRDIKPQNLLLDPLTHVVKLCDFGSAKVLIPGQPNVAYICSRYYRAPELVFEATEYTTSIDLWSLGCVLGEMILGDPLFPGESGVDQLIEIIKVLGTPTKEQILSMNPRHRNFEFPIIAAHPWEKVFRSRANKDVIDLVSRFLQYRPHERLDAFEALAHPFFDELRDTTLRLPNGRPLPPLFNFTPSEVEIMQKKGLVDVLCPPSLKDEILASAKNYKQPPRSESPTLSMDSKSDT